MNTTIEYPEKNTAVINIDVDAATWQNAMDEAKKATGQEDVNLLRQYAISTLASQALENAVINDHLKLATAPAIIADDDDKGGVFITLTCELLPEVKLGAYTGFDLESKPDAVSEEELMEEIIRQVNSRKLWHALPAGTKAENGNRVIIDFVGEKDGVPFEGGTAKNYGLILGSGTFIPGFEEQLVGTVAGEKKDVEVSFPADYFEPSLAGAPVVFHVTVNEVEEEVAPELNDEFIAKMKLEGIKTVEELKNKVRTDMQTLKQQEADNKMMEEALSKISDGMEVDIPQSMVDARVAQMKQEVEGQMKQYGMGLAQYLEMIGQTDEQFTLSLQPQAILEIRQALMLEAIAAKEAIVAEDHEIDEEYNLLSTIYGLPAQQLKAMIAPGAVASSIVQAKTMQFIKENNTKK